MLLLLNSFIIPIFTYAPIVWMFCSKSLCSEIDRVHKCGLRAVFSDFISDYETLLQVSGCKRIHEIHLYYLLVEEYKSQHNLSPSFMETIFQPKSLNYSLRDQNLLLIPPAKTQLFGTQSFQFRGSLLWNALPNSIKSSTSLITFKRLLKALSLIHI